MRRDPAPPAALHAPHVVVLATSWRVMKNYNYLVVDRAGDAVVVDPSWQMETIETAVSAASATLKGVLLTHSHFDHTHLAADVARKYGCPIWMSRAEVAASGFDAPGLVAIGDDAWPVGGLWIEPIPVPGHTPGSVCYRIGENAFTGDVLFAEGCGLCPDVPAAYAMFESLSRLKEMLAPQTRIFPGHSYGVPPGQRFSQIKKSNIYLQFADRESFAAYRLRRGQDATRLFAFR